MLRTLSSLEVKHTFNPTIQESQAICEFKVSLSYMRLSWGGRSMTQVACKVPSGSNSL